MKRDKVIQAFRQLARATGWAFIDECGPLPGRVALELPRLEQRIEGSVLDDGTLASFVAYDDRTGCLHEIGGDPLLIGKLVQKPTAIRKSVWLPSRLLVLRPRQRLTHPVFPLARR